MRPSDFPRGEPAYSQSVQKIIDILDEWFWAIEGGTAKRRSPSLEGKRYSSEEVDQFINQIDEFINREVTIHISYFSPKGIYEPADFNRLTGASREAFMQAIREAQLKYKEKKQVYNYDDE